MNTMLLVVETIARAENFQFSSPYESVEINYGTTLINKLQSSYSGN